MTDTECRMCNLYHMSPKGASEVYVRRHLGKVWLPETPLKAVVGRFEIPEKTGKHRFYELVKLPDYLAGTLADLDSETMAVTREKFDVVLNNVFVNSKNNWVVQLLSAEDRITARSALFRGWS